MGGTLPFLDPTPPGLEAGMAFEVGAEAPSLEDLRVEEEAVDAADVGRLIAVELGFASALLGCGAKEGGSSALRLEDVVAALD